MAKNDRRVGGIDDAIWSEGQPQVPKTPKPSLEVKPLNQRGPIPPLVGDRVGTSERVSPSGRVFELTRHLSPVRRPKRKRKRSPIVLAAICLGYLLWRVIAGGGSVAIGLGEIALAALVVPSIWLGPAFVVSRRRSGRNGLYWKGFVAFYNEDISDQPYFSSLVVKRYKTRRFVQSRLSGGALEIRNDGLHWSSSTYLTRHPRFGGTFFIPWSEVRSVDVGLIPGKVKALGGEITFELGEEDLWVGGEFLARKSNLIRSLQRAQRYLDAQHHDVETPNDTTQS